MIWSFILLLCLLVSFGCERKTKPNPVPQDLHLSSGTPLVFEVEAGSSVAPYQFGVPNQSPGGPPEAGSTLGQHRSPAFTPPRFIPEAGSTTGRRVVPNLTPHQTPKRWISQPQIIKTDATASEEIRRYAELSAILANRHRFRNVVEPVAQEEYSRFVPRELRDLLGNVRSIGIGNNCELRYPLVALTLNKEHSEPGLNLVLNANCQVEYGIQFSGTFNLVEQLEALHNPTNPATEQVVHLECDSGPLTLEACQLISKMSLRSLKLKHCQLTDEMFAEIINNKTLEALELIDPSESLSLSAISSITSLSNLKQFRLHETLTNYPQHASTDNFDSLCQALTKMSQLEYLHIDRGIASKEAVKNFLHDGDRTQLRYLSLKNEPLTLWQAEHFDRCSNLEEVSIHIATSRSDYITYFLSALNRSARDKLRSVTIKFPENDIMTDLRAAAVLNALAKFPNMEKFNIPLKIQHATHLEALTQMGKLQEMSLLDLSVDRDVLFILCRIPCLNSLTAKSLNVGTESAHLTPWLNIVSLHVEDQQSLRDQHIHLLAHSPRLRDISFWSPNNGVGYEVQRLYPHITFHEWD